MYFGLVFTLGFIMISTGVNAGDCGTTIADGTVSSGGIVTCNAGYSRFGISPSVCTFGSWIGSICTLSSSLSMPIVKTSVLALGLLVYYITL